MVAIAQAAQRWRSSGARAEMEEQWRTMQLRKNLQCLEKWSSYGYQSAAWLKNVGREGARKKAVYENGNISEARALFRVKKRVLDGDFT